MPEEIPAGKIAIVIRDDHSEPIPIYKLVQWRIQLPDTEVCESKLKITSRLPGGVLWNVAPGSEPLEVKLLKPARFQVAGRIEDEHGKPGYGTWGHRIDNNGAEFMTFTLSPAATISGRVLDMDGKPIARAEVWAW